MESSIFPALLMSAMAAPAVPGIAFLIPLAQIALLKALIRSGIKG